MDETERLVAELLTGVPDEVANRIATAAEGVPLFVEHLVAMLLEDGVLARDGVEAVPGAKRLHPLLSAHDGADLFDGGRLNDPIRAVGKVARPVREPRLPESGKGRYGRARHRGEKFQESSLGHDVQR